MERRDFFKKSFGAAVAAGLLSGNEIIQTLNLNTSDDVLSQQELNQHIIDGIEFTEIKLKYPRQVGRNAIKGIHGFGPSITVATLKTNKGASGWGELRGNLKDAKDAFGMVMGKPLSDFFTINDGVINNTAKAFDIPFHDLAGRILQKPVYKLLGGDKPYICNCYSGMIYFDDLDQPDNKSGLDKILEECSYDKNFGYKQLKVKIGRGNKWLPGEDGLKRDIEVTRLISKTFPEIEILADGNDGFTPEGIIDYLKGIDDIPLFWIEEPFPETVEKYTVLRNWTRNNGHVKYLADGEANVDYDLVRKLEDLNLIDVCLHDIMGFGFTPWRNLMPLLKKKNILASPHNWGDFLKTVYTVHLAGALGNVATIEGVTCTSDDVDFSGYKLINGKYSPVEAPGFGLKLLKKS